MQIQGYNNLLFDKSGYKLSQNKLLYFFIGQFDLIVGHFKV